MDTRKFNKIGKDISLLGFGGMRFPTNGGAGDIDYEASQMLIDHAMASGINYYDTGYGYHDGASETFLGHALKKYPRDSFYLATKMPTWEALVKEEGDVERIFNEQLEKCQVDYFDFYLAHALSEDHKRVFDQFGMYEFLRNKKEAGVIQHLGFSYHDNPEVLERILEEHDWDFVQIQLNYIDWEASNAERQYELLAERNIPVIIMEPVRGGALATLNAQAEGLLKNYNREASLASWAMRYVGSLPGVMTVLSGMGDMEVLGDNIATFSNFTPLTDEEREVLDEAKAAYLSSGAIPCTACRYCMDCPSGVDIPRVFALYNHYLATDNVQGFKNTYRGLVDEERAQNCISCGSCIPLCPQGIEIIEHMEQVASFASGLGV